MSNDKVIAVWVVVMNCDPDQTYVFTDPRQVMALVLSGVSAYLDPGGSQANWQECVGELQRCLQESWRSPYIPLQIGGLTATIHRVEFDHHSYLFRLLSGVCDVLDGVSHDPRAGELRTQLVGLFRDRV